MNMKFLLLVLAGTAAASIGFAAMAQGGTPTTRALRQDVNVPAGGGITVENLVGEMQVVQGTGPAGISATVHAAGPDAAALAQSVRLEVATTGNEVRVHVFYPVDRYQTYLYSPVRAKTDGSDEFCILGKWLCFHGHSHDTLTYQGQRVTVNQSRGGGSGAPLYVDVKVTVPAGVHATFSNDIGLLDVAGLTDDLGLDTEGGDIHARDIHGRLDAASSGGDVTLATVATTNARVETAGGDLVASALSGRFDIATAGGDATVSGANGDLQVATGGGDAKLRSIAGNLSVESGGGDVDLGGSLASLGALEAGTGGGNLTVSAGLPTLKTLDATSGGGDIVFRTSGLSLHLQASSGGGDLNIKLPDMRNADVGSDRFSGDIGAAAGSGSLRSGGGDITVTQL